MTRTIPAVALMSLLALPAAAQIGGNAPVITATGRLNRFLEGTPTTNEITSLFLWQEEEKLVVVGWLGEKMSAEESIFVNLQPVFEEKGKKAKKEQLIPRMRKREKIELEWPVPDALRVEARYATTGGRIQTGKTTDTELLEVPPPGQSMEVFCQRTSGLEQVRCVSELIEGVPSREDVKALADAEAPS